MTPSPPPEPDEKGWIAHDGVGQPVSNETRVAVRFRCGITDLDDLAGHWAWVWNVPGQPGDYSIIAYRVVSK